MTNPNKLALSLAAVLVCATAGTASAKPKLEAIKYKEGKTALEGVIAYDDAVTGKRPAVLVVHDWMGISEHTKGVLTRLAELGYVAMAADIYGKADRPKDMAAAGKAAGKYKGNRKLLRARANAALTALGKHKLVDASQVAATGYCFGGTAALELARSGAPLVAVISFHGGLDTPTPADARNIKGKVLALHGADDPHVPPEQVMAFMKEMKEAGVDYQLVAYGGAVHAFTVPGAGTDPSKGAAYDARADKRSWEDMKQLLAEAFQPAPPTPEK